MLYRISKGNLFPFILSCIIRALNSTLSVGVNLHGQHIPLLSQWMAELNRWGKSMEMYLAGGRAFVIWAITRWQGFLHQMSQGQRTRNGVHC